MFVVVGVGEFLSVVVWGVTGVGTVGVMDRGYAIKFSYGRYSVRNPGYLVLYHCPLTK